MNVSDIPAGDAPQALEFPHFPTRFQAVIWRNWNLVHPAQVAAVLHTTEAEIVQAASDMGLTRDDRALKLWRERGFQTVIRRNWELLDYPQLLENVRITEAARGKWDKTPSIMEKIAEAFEFKLMDEVYSPVKKVFMKICELSK